MYDFSAASYSYDPDVKTHELYVIEPSGVMYRYFGAAVGKGRQVGTEKWGRGAGGDIAVTVVSPH